MPEVTIDKGLDVLDLNAPALSTTSDIPVIETHPDAVNKPAEEAKEEATETAAADEAKTPEESATPEQTESTSATTEGEPKKPAKGVQKRLDELVKQREDEKRRADANESEKLRLLALLEAQAKPPAKAEETATEEAEPVRPMREQFAEESDYNAAVDQYVSERAAFIAKREFQTLTAEQERKTKEAAAVAEQQKARDAYVQRVEKTKEKYPDYQSVAESPDVNVSIPMAHAIAHAEDGPEIAYFLGSHKDEATRIFALPPQQQLMELGKISAKLSQPAASKPVSAAPAPGKPIKATTETKIDPQDESMEAYAARRKKEMAAAARPGVRH